MSTHRANRLIKVGKVAATALKQYLIMIITNINVGRRSGSLYPPDVVLITLVG